MVKSVVLVIIKVNQALFYNTWFHRQPIVNFIYKKLFALAFSKRGVEQVNFHGAIFFVPTRDITILPSMLNNDYEQAELEILKKILKKGMNFIDAGANVGIYSILGSQIVGHKGRVFSFEPESSNFELLSKNAQANHCRNITLENRALGDKNSNVKLYIAKDSIGTHSMLGATKKFEIVPQVTLDSYLSKLRCKINVIKIDIEGYEPFALKGMSKTLQQNPFVLLEYNQLNNTGEEPDEMLKLLNKNFKFIYLVDKKTRKPIRINNSDLLKRKYANLLVSNKEPVGL